MQYHVLCRDGNLGSHDVIVKAVKVESVGHYMAFISNPTKELSSTANVTLALQHYSDHIDPNKSAN